MIQLAKPVVTGAKAIAKGVEIGLIVGVAMKVAEPISNVVGRGMYKTSNIARRGGRSLMGLFGR